jgi:hypothetical protein
MVTTVTTPKVSLKLPPAEAPVSTRVGSARSETDELVMSVLQEAAADSRGRYWAGRWGDTWGLAAMGEKVPSLRVRVVAGEATADPGGSAEQQLLVDNGYLDLDPWTGRLVPVVVRALQKCCAIPVSRGSA